MAMMLIMNMILRGRVHSKIKMFYLGPVSMLDTLFFSVKHTTAHRMSNYYIWMSNYCTSVVSK